MTLQEQFEVWAQEAPREWSIEKQSELGAFPGQYRDYHVQAAWEAWEAAAYLRTTGDTPEMIFASLRDDLAAKAMQGMAGSHGYCERGWDQKDLFRQAYELADAMLASWGE